MPYGTPDTSAGIGADFSNYQGNGALGGASNDAFGIDVSHPLAQLAAYTNLYNKSVWDQAQSDATAKIKEISDGSDIDLNQLLPHDQKEITQSLSDWQSYLSDFARKNPTSIDEKLSDQVEYQNKKQQIFSKYNSGKQRAVTYLAHKNTILNNTTDASQQDIKFAALDKTVNDTDITTPLSALPQYKMTTIDVPNVIPSSLDVAEVGGDNNVLTKVGFFNPAQNSGSADAAVLGIGQTYIPKQIKDKNGDIVDNPAYTALSGNQENAQDLQNDTESQAKLWNDMTVPFNKVRAQYVDADGNFNEAKFVKDNASNSVVMRAYNALKSYGDYSDDHANQAKSGVFQDKGLSYAVPSTSQSKLIQDFQAGHIDFSNPISPNQLVSAGIYSNYNGDTFVKKVTTNEMAKERLQQASSTDRTKMIISGENYRATLPYNELKKSEQAKLDAANAATTTAPDKPNILYNINLPQSVTVQQDGLPAYSIKNGVAVDNEGNVVPLNGVFDIPKANIDASIPTEFNKYHAVKLDKDGQPTSSANAPTLAITDKKYVVKFENGVISGIKLSGDESSGGGTFAGLNDFAAITDASANKGVTKYHPPTRLGVQQGVGNTPKLTQAQKYLQSLRQQ